MLKLKRPHRRRAPRSPRPSAHAAPGRPPRPACTVGPAGWCALRPDSPLPSGLRCTPKSCTCGVSLSLSCRPDACSAGARQHALRVQRRLLRPPVACLRSWAGWPNSDRSLFSARFAPHTPPGRLRARGATRAASRGPWDQNPRLLGAPITSAAISPYPGSPAWEQRTFLAADVMRDAPSQQEGRRFKGAGLYSRQQGS